MREFGEALQGARDAGGRDLDAASGSEGAIRRTGSEQVASGSASAANIGRKSGSLDAKTLALGAVVLLVVALVVFLIVG
jgi:hypothetical protein